MITERSRLPCCRILLLMDAARVCSTAASLTPRDHRPADGDPSAPSKGLIADLWTTLHSTDAESSPQPPDGVFTPPPSGKSLTLLDQPPFTPEAAAPACSLTTRGLQQDALPSAFALPTNQLSLVHDIHNHYKSLTHHNPRVSLATSDEATPI